MNQYIYKQKIGNKFDDLNKILSNKNIFRSSNTNIEVDMDSNTGSGNNKSNTNSNSNKEEEKKSENDLSERNREYILKQYNNPFLLSISHNINNGDLSMFHVKNKKIKKLKTIKETSELNENNSLNESVENSLKNNNDNAKNFYGVDFDIYSNKSSSSISEKSNSKKSDINIEMEDLSEKNNYETIKDISLNYKNEKKFKEKNNNNNIYHKKIIKDSSMSMTKGEINYDGDYDSDYEI